MYSIDDIRKEMNRLDKITGENTSQIPIKITKATKRYGCCKVKILSFLSKRYYTPEILYFSDIILCDEETFFDTIRHEYAHAILTIRDPYKNHGHDNVWKSVCLEVGAMPERYGKINDNIKEQIEKKIKYTVVCNCCGKEFKYQSKSKIIKAIENGTANTLYHCSCGKSNFSLK